MRVLPLTVMGMLYAAALQAGTFPAATLDTARQLMVLAQQGNTAHGLVESLTTEVGPRLAGTEAESRARAWAVSTLEASGFSNVHVESFAVPRWLRGEEHAEVLAPYPQALVVTALGGSTSTGPAGVTAEVAPFDTVAALSAVPAGSLGGRIAFVNERMTRTQDGSGYGVAVQKRLSAAAAAHAAGASAVLIRSVGTDHDRLPHTGQIRLIDYETDMGVPAAALAAPDADQLQRILERGTVPTIKLVLTPQTLSPGTSGNVIAEIPGRESPGEIVLVGAHLDSWDLGTGAVDDGAGVGIVVAAAQLLAQLPQRPRRTVRVVLFGAEEIGYVGAQAYARQHADELAAHVVAVESDFGSGDIWRFDTRFGAAGQENVGVIAGLLQPLGINPGNDSARGGPDLGYLREAGVPVVDLKQNGWDYFDLHHTANDTLDKIAPGALDQNVAAYAAFLYLAADSEASFR